MKVSCSKNSYYSGAGKVTCCDVTLPNNIPCILSPSSCKSVAPYKFGKEVWVLFQVQWNLDTIGSTAAYPEYRSVNILESCDIFPLGVAIYTRAVEHYKASIVPRLCAFVACSTKFAQRAWARSSRDVCHSHIFTSADNNVCRVAYIHVQWSFKLKHVKRIR